MRPSSASFDVRLDHAAIPPWRSVTITATTKVGTMRREVLNAEWLTSIKQAQIVIETWLKQYNHIRPHQALNMRPPVPETLSGSGT